MQDISDDLLVKASEGDLRSFEAIYKAAAGFVYNVAYRVVGKKEDAEEVTQEVFMTVYHKLKSFRYQSSFKTWVYRIAVNSAINHAKKVSKERNRTVEYDENLTAVHAPAEAHVRMDQEQQEETVNALLNELNPEQRACIVLRNMEGLSYQEIAETLGINLNTVRSRLKRGRETLVTLGKEVIKHGL
jgi:RNA polymerase sigma-70 factor (ECF subfamily)